MGDDVVEGVKAKAHCRSVAVGDDLSLSGILDVLCRVDVVVDNLIVIKA